jgi:hypothetical protein
MLFGSNGRYQARVKMKCRDDLGTQARWARCGRQPIKIKRSYLFSTRATCFCTRIDPNNPSLRACGLYSAITFVQQSSIRLVIKAIYIIRPKPRTFEQCLQAHRRLRSGSNAKITKASRGIKKTYQYANHPIRHDTHNAIHLSSTPAHHVKPSSSSFLPSCECGAMISSKPGMSPLEDLGTLDKT